MADNNSLFSDEVLDSLAGNDQQENQGPVTVLGKTFANDEERRAYFREELRKKLPELKQIEGYPIGEDDDIINLSDPPYYTACPNPWLNDFIDEWENEKKELEIQGIRTKDFNVTEPYASDVSEGKNNPIYNAHSYHTKVPHPAIMRYLLHYTQPGDIVFDGFCGTGMTGVAANLCGDTSYNIVKESNNSGLRHALLSDLSPVASLISANYNSPKTKKDVFKHIASIISDVENKYSWMYCTTNESGQHGIINYTVWSDVFVCPNCGKEYDFFNTAVDQSTNEVFKTFNCPHCNSSISKNNSEKSLETVFDQTLKETVTRQKKIPVLINYSIGKRSYSKKLSHDDFDIVKRCDELASSFCLFSDRMPEGTEARRNDRQGITHVHHFYFPRALVILQELFNKCDSKEFLFLLNSQLINLSKLNRYRPGVSFPYNPLSGTLYIGSQISEANVFIALKNKIKKIKAALDMLDSKNVTSVVSATCPCIKSNSIDYIFTDPPFGSNFSYSELNSIQETWLRVKTNNEKEAIVNDSMGKHVFEYQTLMYESFLECYRVLKPGKWMTVEFSNTSASIWNAIQLSLQQAGFVVANVAALDKQQGSFKAVTTTTAVKQDLVITCYKPSSTLLSQFENSNDVLNIWDFIDDYLQHLPIHIIRGNSTTAIVERSAKILFDRLITYYVQKGYPVPIDASAFQHGLRERYIEKDGMFFTAAQATEYEEKKKLAPEFVPMGIIVSDEANGIQWLRNQLEYTPKTYQDIQPDWMQAINGVRKNDIIPELKQLLEENFIQEVDGKWRCPNIQDDKDVNALRTKALLKEFKLYVEQASKPKGKLKEVRVEAVRAGFKQCYIDKDFQTIVTVGDKIPQNLLTEDEILLQFYDIAVNHV